MTDQAHDHEHTETESKMAGAILKMQEHIQYLNITEQILRRALKQTMSEGGIVIDVLDLNMANDERGGVVQSLKVFFAEDGELDIAIES